jgi:hypothetical protein
MREGSTPKSIPRVAVCGAASAIGPHLPVVTLRSGRAHIKKRTSAIHLGRGNDC